MRREHDPVNGGEWFRRRKRLLLFLYASVILVMYLYPFNMEKTVNRVHVLTIRGDYWLHMLLFVPLPFLAYRFGRCQQKHAVPGPFCACIAAAAEGIHYFLPYRSFNPFDMLANVTGILLSALILGIVHARGDR